MLQHETGEHFRYLTAIDDRIARDKRMLRVLENKHCIIVIGKTGAGKSALINSIVLGEGAIVEDDQERLALSPHHQHIEVDGRKMFLIGHDAVAGTETPGYCMLRAVDQ